MERFEFEMKLSDKRILFKVSGSFEIGFGHIRRSITLANEIAKQVNPDNIFIYCDCPDNDVSNLLQLYKFFLESKDTKGIIDCVRINDIHILVFDEPKDNLEICEVLKKTNPEVFTVALDYFNYNNQYIDAIINLFNHNLNACNIQGVSRRRYYEGLKYAIIRDSFNKYIERDRKINSDVDNILITFGGADMSNNTVKALNLLSSLGYKGKVDVIVGPFFRNREEILECAKHAEYNCSVHKEVTDIEKRIFNADVGFIGSGTTLMEFCSVGTPAIVMPQNAKEYNFAKLFELNKAVKVAYPDKEVINLIRCVVNSKILRKEMSENSKKMIDGNGKKRIGRLILDV